jgi:hypothetical protein
VACARCDHEFTSRRRRAYVSLLLKERSEKF